MAQVTSTPVGGRTIENHISRCVVCEAPSTPVALHSQTSSTPECPPNWTSLWKGFSFLMVSIAAPAAAGVSFHPDDADDDVISCMCDSILVQVMRAVASL